MRCDLLPKLYDRDSGLPEVDRTPAPQLRVEAVEKVPLL